MIKIPLEYQTWGKEGIGKYRWFKYNIPWNLFWNGYERTDYIENETGNFVLGFRYKFPLNIILWLIFHIWDIPRQIKYVIPLKIKRILNQRKEKIQLLENLKTDINRIFESNKNNNIVNEKILNLLDTRIQEYTNHWR